MSSPVIIKGYKCGLRFIVAPGATMPEIKLTLENGLKKITKPSDIESSALIGIKLEGEKLTPDDISELQNSLKKYGINTYIDKQNTKNTKAYSHQDIHAGEGLFLIGNIKRGQIVEAACSIVILGDVEAGARVVSSDNVVIIGKQLGYVEAGSDGKTSSFVYSMISGRNM